MSEEVLAVSKRKRGRPKEEDRPRIAEEKATRRAEIESRPAHLRGGKPGKRRAGADRTTTIELKKTLNYAVKGLTIPEISRALDVPELTTKDRLALFEPIFSELVNVPAFESVRKDVLAATELRLLKSLADEDKIEKASLNNAAYAFTQVHNARRLESGLSTTNIASQITIDHSGSKSKLSKITGS